MRIARAIVIAATALALLSSTAWAKDDVDRRPGVKQASLINVSTREDLPVGEGADLRPVFGDSAIEIEFWRTIKHGGDRVLFEAYLDQYPSGTFAPIARRKLEKLGPTQEAAIAPVPPAYTIEERDAPYVVSSMADILSGPGTNHDTLTTLQVGTEVTVTGEVKGQDWYRIALEGGTSGFVYAALVEDKASWDRAHLASVRPGSTFRDCADCPEMVVIPSGRFQMGDINGGGNDDEKPVHTVNIDYTFAVGKYEVTRDEYARFVSATGRSDGDGCYYFTGNEWEKDDSASWRNPGFNQTASDPVVCVNWDDAKAYVAWLSRTTGEPYRLLSESEWEYVGRAGSTAKYPFGDSEEELCFYGNGIDIITPSSDKDGPCIDRPGVATFPAGSFRANGFGLHDMVGNAWEWVEDSWHDSYSGAPSDGSAWIIGGDCGRRVVRGGTWASTPPGLRSAFRDRGFTSNRTYFTGFRVARAVSGP